MSIYKYGDKVKVITNGNWKTGTVTSVRGNYANGYVCIVKFDNRFMMPPEMEFKEELLTPHDGGRVGILSVNIEKSCPACGQEWHIIESPIHGKKEIWKDCLKCNKTKEQLMKEIAK